MDEMFNWEKVPEVNGHKVFVPEEFDDPDYPGSGVLMHRDTMRKLVALRLEMGWPIIVHTKIGGAVDMNGTHGHALHSYHLKRMECRAVDFHFKTNVDSRLQVRKVFLASFTGVGVYYDWHWDDVKLPVGFHVDTRPEEDFQIWKRSNGQYEYFLL